MLASSLSLGPHIDPDIAGFSVDDEGMDRVSQSLQALLSFSFVLLSGDEKSRRKQDQLEILLPSVHHDCPRTDTNKEEEAGTCTDFSLHHAALQFPTTANETVAGIEFTNSLSSIFCPSSSSDVLDVGKKAVKSDGQHFLLCADNLRGERDTTSEIAVDF